MKPKNEIKVLLSKDQMIEDLSLVHPECKDQIPHMVEMVQDHIETMVTLASEGAFWLGWNSAQRLIKNTLVIRAFWVILLSPVFITVGSKLVGEGLLAIFIGAALGAFMLRLWDEGIEGIQKLLKEREKQDEL